MTCNPDQQTPTFGLTYEAILQAYPGTVENDFDWGNSCGREVIEAEILRQASKLQALLPRRLLRLLRSVRFVRITADEEGVFELPLPIKEGTLPRVFRDWWCSGSCGPGLGGRSVPCNLQDYYNCEPRLVVEVVEPAEGEPPFDCPTFRVVPPQTNLIVSWDLPHDLAIGSLSTLLRDMVACALGRRLYASEDDGDWSLVTYYCDSAKDFLAALDGRWTPPELLLRTAFAAPIIQSHGMTRVN